MNRSKEVTDTNYKFTKVLLPQRKWQSAYGNSITTVVYFVSVLNNVTIHNSAGQDNPNR